MLLAHTGDIPDTAQFKVEEFGDIYGIFAQLCGEFLHGWKGFWFGTFLPKEPDAGGARSGAMRIALDAVAKPLSAELAALRIASAGAR